MFFKIYFVDLLLAGNILYQIDKLAPLQAPETVLQILTDTSLQSASDGMASKYQNDNYETAFSASFTQLCLPQ